MRTCLVLLSSIAFLFACKPAAEPAVESEAQSNVSTAVTD